MYRTFAVLMIAVAASQSAVSAQTPSAPGDPDSMQSEVAEPAPSEPASQTESAQAAAAPAQDVPASPGNDTDLSPEQAPEAAPSVGQDQQLAMSGAGYNMFHPMNMMNPAMYMNMMHPMMGYASPMYSSPIDAMTNMQTLDMMMRAMDPHMIFGMFGQPGQAYGGGQVPDRLPVFTIPGFPTQSYQNWPMNKVSPGVSREAKKNAFQTAMAISPLSMRDMISIMADKIPVDGEVSWDDAVEAMKLRANEINFKFVGSSALWKEIEAVTGQPSARVEMFRFCDAAVARKILDVVPEFVIFLPCSIALIEDGQGKLWVMTLDWDIEWMDFAQNTNSHMSKEVREDAVRIREALAYIMEGAASGEF